MPISRNSNLKSKILSFLITALVLFLLILSGPASALTLNLTSNISNVQKGLNVEFTADIDIDSGEILDIDYILLEFSGPDNILCKFDANGAVISGCSGITISKTSSPTFGYGYGYNFGYSYGYTNGKLAYKIILDTANYQTGTYTSILTVSSGSQLFSKQGPNLTINQLQTDNNGNSGSNSNSNINDEDDNSGCFTQWICSEWSACTDGSQVRTCEKAIKHCTASKTPELIQSCSSIENLIDSGDNRDIEDLEISQDEIKEIYGENNLFNTITGAVTGAAGSPWTFGAVIFVILVIVLSFAVYLRRR